MTDVEDPVDSLQEENFTTVGGTLHNVDPKWVKWDNSRKFPKNALCGGIDIHDEVISVGRAKHDNCLLVAKVIESQGRSLIALDGKEIEVKFVEILVDDGRYCWEFGKNGAVPATAVKVGKRTNGEIVYVGRAIIETSMTPGTILQSKGVLSIPFGDAEHVFMAYQVLCYKPVEQRNRSRTDRFFIEVGRVVCSVLDCVFRTKLVENYPTN